MPKTFHDKEGVVSFTCGDTRGFVIVLHDICREYTEIERAHIAVLFNGRPMPAKLCPGQYILHYLCISSGISRAASVVAYLLDASIYLNSA